MHEIYSFDEIKSYKIAVTMLSDGEFEGICYQDHPHHPFRTVFGGNGEAVRQELIVAARSAK